MFLKKFYSNYKNNILLSYHIILSQAGQILVSTVDNMMVGHVGVSSLAACAFSNSVFVNFLVIGLGFSFGITPLVGKALGRKNFDRISLLLKQSLMINILMGILLFLLLYFFSFLLSFMGQEEGVVNLSTPYLRLLAFSLIPLMLFFSLKQFFEGLQKTKITMVIVLSSNILNIILNYIWIFGHLGFEKMGLLGAGYATLVSRIFMALAILVYLLKTKEGVYIKVNFFKNLFKTVYFKKIFFIGLPSALQLFMECMAFSITTIMMGWINEVSLAAHQIALNYSTMLYMVISGLAASATIRVSSLWGKKNYLEIITYVHSYYHMVIGIAILNGIILFFIKDFIAGLYIDNIEVTSLATNFILIGGIFFIFDGLQTVFIYSLRGLEDVYIPTLIAFFSYWVITICASYFMAFHTSMGAYGIWVGYLIGLTTASLLLMLRFRYLKTTILKIST